MAGLYEHQARHSALTVKISLASALEREVGAVSRQLTPWIEKHSQQQETLR